MRLRDRCRRPPGVTADRAAAAGPRAGVISRRFHLLFVLLLLALAPACDDPYAPGSVAAMRIIPSPLNLPVGGQRQLEVVIVDSLDVRLPHQPVLWESLDTSVFVVNADGVAAGVAVGSSRLVATVSGVSDTTDVSVHPAGPATNSAHACVVAADAKLYCWGWGLNGQLGTGAMASSNTPVAVRPDELRFATVSVGAGHSCALALDGEAYCWGRGGQGQLGDGGVTSSPAPTRVSFSGWFSQLSAGGNHTCGIDVGGVAYCWGDNAHGQIGNESRSGQGSPVYVHSAERFTAVVAGTRHTCGLAADGGAICWGDNTDGQLGDGTTSDRLQPVRVLGGRTFVELAAGELHTCGLTPAGDVYCWGRGEEGQLGLGHTEGRVEPAHVAAPEPLGTLVAGARHTCGLADDGSAYCWGFGGFGQLGHGARTTRSSPVAVAGGERFRDLLAGEAHTCGLLADSAEIRCWGFGGFGQLGTGGYETHSKPVAVPAGFEPDLLAGHQRRAERGSRHTCALDEDGRAYCWGEGDRGRLGSGGVADAASPTPVAGGLRFRQLATGAEHSCGIALDGAAHCWGSNRVGQLGDGGSEDSSVPVPVAGGLTFSAITLGDYHACGINAASAGVHCWGLNSRGQLGSGSGSPLESRPVATDGGMLFSTIAAGLAHTCGSTLAGEGYCWGAGEHGQLGNGARGDQHAPTRLAGDLGMALISAGGRHTCAVMVVLTGPIYCWGDDAQLQLATGLRAGRLIPGPISRGGGYTAIASGLAHSCAVAHDLPDRPLLCWGRGLEGQIGDGGTASRGNLTAVTGLTGVSDVFLGAGHSCALLDSGAAYCWGAGENGELGSGVTGRFPSPQLVSGGVSFRELAQQRSGACREAGCGLGPATEGRGQ